MSRFEKFETSTLYAMWAAFDDAACDEREDDYDQTENEFDMLRDEVDAELKRRGEE